MEEVAKVDGVAEECEELLGRVRDQRVQLMEEVARFKKVINEAKERKEEAELRDAPAHDEGEKCPSLL